MTLDEAMSELDKLAALPTPPWPAVYGPVEYRKIINVIGRHRQTIDEARSDALSSVLGMVRSGPTFCRVRIPLSVDEWSDGDNVTVCAFVSLVAREN